MHRRDRARRWSTSTAGLPSRSRPRSAAGGSRCSSRRATTATSAPRERWCRQRARRARARAGEVPRLRRRVLRPAKGWVSAVGVALSRPMLARKMTGLHSISAYVDEVTRRYLLKLDDEAVGDGPVVEVDDPELPGRRRAGDGPRRPTRDRRGVAGEAAGRAVHPLRRRVSQGQGPRDPVRRLRPALRRRRPLVLMGTYERDSPATSRAEARASSRRCRTRRSWPPGTGRCSASCRRFCPSRSAGPWPRR